MADISLSGSTVSELCRLNLQQFSVKFVSEVVYNFTWESNQLSAQEESLYNKYKYNFKAEKEFPTT